MNVALLGKILQRVNPNGPKNMGISALWNRETPQKQGPQTLHTAAGL